MSDLSTLLPELIPWTVLLIMFFGMLALQWRVIGALDQALARIAPEPARPLPHPPVITPPTTPAGPSTTVEPPPVHLPPPIPKPAPGPVLPPPAPIPSGPFATAPDWFQFALHEIGFHETGNNQGLDRYIGLANAGANGDPWCAIFVNACLESVGLPGSRSASSQSFRTNPNFVKLDGPCLGAIVVFWRGTPTSGLGHVAFYRGEDTNRIWALGGNENDMVQIEALQKSAGTFGLIGYWWPKSVPLPPTARPIIMPAGSPTNVQVNPTKSSSMPTDATTDGSGKQTDIVATMFGGQKSAYGGAIIDSAPGVALPARFSSPRPRVRVTGKNSGVSVDCDIVDVGPWNTHDPYWQTGSRPQSEGGTDTTGRKTNKAGIDLTLAAAQAAQIDGKGLVDWEFITGPSTPVSVT